MFLVTDWGGEPTLGNTEHDALGWFTAAQAQALELADAGIASLLTRIASGEWPVCPPPPTRSRSG